MASTVCVQARTGGQKGNVKGEEARKKEEGQISIRITEKGEDEEK